MGDVMLVAEVVPLDLFISVLKALVVAEQELQQLDRTEMPLPEEVVEQLRERKLMLDAIAAAPGDVVDKLRELYAKADTELEHFSEPGGPTVTLMPNVLADVDQVWELLRRAALTEPAVNEALRRTTA